MRSIEHDAPDRGTSRLRSGLCAALACALACHACVAGEHASVAPCGTSAALYGAESITLDAGERVPEEAVGALESGYGTLYGTAFLIAPAWVLTAAHVALDGGRLRLSDLALAPIALGAAHLHPSADLALIEVLDPRAVSAQGVVPLPVSTEEGAWSGETLRLVGAGLTEDGTHGEVRRVHETVVEVRDDSIVVDGFGRTGACSGDSGGPLLASRDDGRFEVVGVLSAGSSDCLGRDAYVRVDRHADWIAATTRARHARCTQPPP